MTSTPRLAGDWSDLVVIVGAVRWQGSRMVDHHLAEGLARYGPVLYVDPPRPWRPGRGHLDGARPGATTTDLDLIRPGLALVTPSVLPGHQRPGMKAVSIALVRRTMRTAVAELGSPAVRAVIVPSLDRGFGACDEAHRVFYATDDFVAGSELMRLSARRLRREEARQLRDADLVVAASPALADGFRARGHDAALLPNGCDPVAFAGTEQAEPAADVERRGPTIGFMGHLSSRMDVRYIEAVAARGHEVLLIGPGPGAGLTPELERLVSRPNVRWTGPRPFAGLPSYLRHVDVGLVPYADTPFNRASFPLKALEYLAAGRPVVSTDIPAIAWVRDGHNVGASSGPGHALTGDDIAVARTPEEFADEAGRLLAVTRDAAAIERRQAAARRHSWDERYAVLAGWLGLADGVRTDPTGRLATAPAD